jgi:RNA polymerase sigma factor (TIGR02999 family)
MSMLTHVGAVTAILTSMERGDPSASEQLLPLVYDELRKLAAVMMAREKPGHTLQATALVHEAYMRLVDGEQAQRWDSRRHFFGAAAEAMRRILVESARRRGRIKRGGELVRVPLDDVPIACPVAQDDLLALDDALQKLAKEDAASAEIVRLRCFAGLNHEEAAAVLGVSAVTAKRSWRYARAWLHREMRGRSALPETG